LPAAALADDVAKKFAPRPHTAIGMLSVAWPNLSSANDDGA
jgi:hypothetical protein